LKRIHLAGLSLAVSRIRARMTEAPLTDEVVFDQFVAAFEEELAAVVRRRGLLPSASLDQNVALIGHLDRDALHRALGAAHARIVGPQVPLDRLGDRLCAYMLFVMDHGRLPRDRLLLNDVLYRINTTDEILEPLRVFVSDKELVKLYVGATVGDRHNVPTLAVLRSPEEAASYAFPPDCCIKATHASGATIFRRGGSKVDLHVVRQWFGLNYYVATREANYRNLRPKVIVEPILESHLADPNYKIFCWRGEPKLVQVGLVQPSQDPRRYFDAQWNEVSSDGALYTPLPKPERLDEMLALARALSSRFDLVRVDLYVLRDTVLVGEITNCHWAGRDRFRNFAFEQKLSDIVFRSP
jgi:hypothetical protein